MLPNKPPPTAPAGQVFVDHGLGQDLDVDQRRHRLQPNVQVDQKRLDANYFQTLLGSVSLVGEASGGWQWRKTNGLSNFGE